MGIQAADSKLDAIVSRTPKPSKSVPCFVQGYTAVMEVNTDVDTFIFLDTDAWFEQHSRICCVNISALLVTETGLQQLPTWLNLQYGLFDDFLDTSVTHYYLHLTANHTLRVSAAAGIASVGKHPLRITATHDSFPDQPAAMDLNLIVLGKPPSIVGSFSVVQIADGQRLQYTLPAGVIQLNKPYGSISYSASQQNGQALPGWVSMSQDGTFNGTPHMGTDATWNLTITGTDSDGASNAISLQLVVRVPCPAGQYRHFRVRGLAADPPYGRGFSDSWGFFLCATAWLTAQSGTVFPTLNAQPVNVSGIATDPRSSTSYYKQAFGQLLHQPSQDSLGLMPPCTTYFTQDSWHVRFPASKDQRCLHESSAWAAPVLLLCCRYCRRTSQCKGCMAVRL